MEKLIVPKTGPVADLVKFSNLTNVNTILNAAVPNPYILNPAFNITQPKDKPLYISDLGTPVMSDLTLKAGKYFDIGQNKSVNYPSDGNDIKLLTVISRIVQNINVVTTVIQGAPAGAGEVTEYIGAMNATVNINGIITSANGVYPRGEAKRLHEWLIAPVSKSIVSWWFDNLGISNIIVLGFEIPQNEGEYSQQMFRIDAKADYPVELKVVQPLN